MGARESFEINKIRRVIAASGGSFSFYRKAKNEFGEPTGEDQQIGSVNGLYHTNTAHLTVTNADSGSQVSRRVYTPAILCLVDDISKSVQQGDFVKIGRKLCKVTGVIDYLDKGYAYDICCEVIEDGKESV